MYGSNTIQLTTGSMRTPTFKSIDTIIACSPVTARRAKTLVHFNVAVLAAETRLAPTDDVIASIHTSSSVAIDGGALVKDHVTPTSVVP
jgi:hypothetical protein